VDGNTMTINVKPDVKNLDRVRPGDILRMQYTQIVSLYVREPETGPKASVETEVEVAEKGMPGKTQTTRTHFVATVQAIDQKTRVVTLLGPSGQEETYTVDKSAKKFKNVKVGDEVVVDIIETLAGSVEAVEKK
jgi:hypothetical protein